jgi:hypothetical protein
MLGLDQKVEAAWTPGSNPTGEFGCFQPSPVVAETAGTVAVGETAMIADPKHRPHQDESDGDKRRRQEEALDEALKNTFPASDPVSVEQPTTTGRARRS